MAHDVFISYATNDKAIADAVCAVLEADRIRCWIAPRDVLPGKRFAQVIVDAIHDARVFVLVFSAASNGSPQVEREADRAVSFGLPLLPLRVEDVVPSESMEYYLAGQHWLDALTPPLESHLSRLSQAISILLQPTTPRPAAVIEGVERQDDHTAAPTAPAATVAETPIDTPVETVAEMPVEAVAEMPEETVAEEPAPDVTSSYGPPVEFPPVFEEAPPADASSVAGEIVTEPPTAVEEPATAPPAAEYADWEPAETALAAFGVPLPAAKAAPEPEPAPKAAPEPELAVTAVAEPEPAARAGWRLPLIVGAIAGVAWILIIAISELASR